MNLDSQINAIEQKIRAMISEDPENFLVEIRIRPGNNIRVLIDSDQGISIDKLAQYNRRLYKEIEQTDLFHNDFSLEISSPGLEEPLKLHRQYVKNIGRFVEVILKDGTRKEGKLLGASDTEIIVSEERKNKKNREWVQYQIPYSDIKTTKVQIKF